MQQKMTGSSLPALCYSEGINDDVNKLAWADQDRDLATPAVETLRDDCRLFISPDSSDELAQGRRMILMANDRFLISDQIQSRKPTVQEFAVPREATAGGHLELEWRAAEGERSAEVAEVWLIKKDRQ